MYLHFVSQVNKNYIIELDAEDTIDDVREILNTTYGIKKEIRFFFDGEPVTDLSKFNLNTPISIIVIDNEIPDNNRDIHQRVSQRLSVENKSTKEEIDPPSFRENLERITEMGFDMEDAARALRKCNYDPNEAIELLTSNFVEEEIEEEVEEIDVLTEEDEEAIMRLQGDEFDRSFVTDIYLQCGKDEERAMELLQN